MIQFGKYFHSIRRIFWMKIRMLSWEIFYKNWKIFSTFSILLITLKMVGQKFKKKSSGKYIIKKLFYHDSARKYANNKIKSKKYFTVSPISMPITNHLSSSIILTQVTVLCLLYMIKYPISRLQFILHPSIRFSAFPVPDVYQWTFFSFYQD